jgi:hypothetical protein
MNFSEQKTAKGLSPAELENLYICGECGATVDRRQLDDVIYHINHEHKSDMPPSRAGKIKNLQDAIRAMYDCDSRCVESVSVHEMFHVMGGIVEVLDLIEHPKAKRAYAWQYESGNEIKTLAVLEIPPVNSPESALNLVINRN